jgi:hypothetical protein
MAELKNRILVGLEEIQKFFFKAMLNGYAASKSSGHKAEFREGNFRLLDCWCVNSGSLKSVGTTKIWFRGEPVWVMSYGGYYSKEVTPFLKRALHMAYESGKFVGGRGLCVIEDELFYHNSPRLNDFSRFEGHEEILGNRGEVLLGSHDYWGMALI